MKLTDSEKAMLDGREGPARQKAMELLVRYGEALGAERFVDTNNVAGVPGSSNPFLAELLPGTRATRYDAIFSRFDLDSDELIEVAARQPRIPAICRAASIPTTGRRSARSRRHFKISQDSEAFAAEPRRQDPQDLHALPRRQRADERRALRVDGVLRGRLLQLGARRAHEHRRAREHERRDADGQDPGLGLSPRREPPRDASASRSRCRSRAMMDWGMLGYFVGDVVQERIPVLTGRSGRRISSATSTSAPRPRLVGRRRDVSHRRRHAGGADARGGAGAGNGRSRRFATARPSAGGSTRRSERQRRAIRTSTS